MSCIYDKWSGRVPTCEMGQLICEGEKCKCFKAEYKSADTARITNADRIRAMSDEELARELLAMYLHGHCDCNEENGICITEQSLLDWLKRPVEEEKE